MNGYLWAVGGVTVTVAGALSYFMTRRYGWGAAVALPVVALAAMIGMNWQEQGLDFADGLGLIKETFLFASPILVGVFVGIAVAWRRRA